MPTSKSQEAEGALAAARMRCIHAAHFDGRYEIEHEVYAPRSTRLAALEDLIDYTQPPLDRLGRNERGLVVMVVERWLIDAFEKMVTLLRGSQDENMAEIVARTFADVREQGLLARVDRSPNPPEVAAVRRFRTLCDDIALATTRAEDARLFALGFLLADRAHGTDAERRESVRGLLRESILASVLRVGVTPEGQLVLNGNAVTFTDGRIVYPGQAPPRLIVERRKFARAIVALAQPGKPREQVSEEEVGKVQTVLNDFALKLHVEAYRAEDGTLAIRSRETKRPIPIWFSHDANTGL